jgi:hypothetical protein
MDAIFEKFDLECGLLQAREDHSGSDGWCLNKSIYIDHDAETGDWFVVSRIREDQPSEDGHEPFTESRTDTEGPFNREELKWFLADMRLELNESDLVRLRNLRLIRPKPTRPDV